MSIDLEAELRATFAAETAGVSPPTDLAERVRRATRRRRLSLAGVSGVVVVMLSVSYLVGAGSGVNSHKSLTPADSARTFTIAVTGGVDAIMAAGKLLYVASGSTPNVTAELSVYDQGTGEAVSRVGLPARPQALAVGVDGSIWLTFYPDQSGGSPGVWRLSSDLRQRSALNLATPKYRSAAPFDVLPRDGDKAVLATDFGLATIDLPAPGRPGDATFAVKAGQSGAYTPEQLAATGTGIAVRESANLRQSQRSRIIVDGHPEWIFTPGSGAGIASMSAGADGLWAVVRPAAEEKASLVRLNSHLEQVAPGPVVDDRSLGVPQTVWANGNTVWVATSGGQASLVCFVFSYDQEIKSRISTPDVPELLAATTDQVFVVGRAGVTAYPVPAACR